MIYILLGIVALICGLIVYIIFRPNTHIAKLVFKIIQIELVAPEEAWWFKFYVADFLWAFSLSCFIYAIYLPNAKNAFICSGVVVITGLIYELMQFCEIIPGTGDIVDFLFYLLAATAVNIINFLRSRKNEKKQNY